jgi:uncharacterized membrane protein
MAPRVYFIHIGLTSLLLLLGGIGFALAGAPLVTVFCVLQMLAVMAGGGYFAMHAADGEHVLLYRRKLLVRAFDGLRVTEHVFNPYWVRLKRGRGRQGDEYWICSGGVRLPLGRHMPPARRRQAVSELASALLQCHEALEPDPDGSGGGSLAPGQHR